MVSLSLVTAKIRITPALVDWRPGHDAGMTNVPSHHFHPLLIETTHVFHAEVMTTCHFAPNQETEAVSPVHEARVLNLLMFATSVEPHSFGQFYVSLQG